MDAATSRSMTVWLLRRFAFGGCFGGFGCHCSGCVTLSAGFGYATAAFDDVCPGFGLPVGSCVIFLAADFGYATTTFDIGVEIRVWTVFSSTEWFKLRSRHQYPKVAFCGHPIVHPGLVDPIHNVHKLVAVRPSPVESVPPLNATRRPRRS